MPVTVTFKERIPSGGLTELRSETYVESPLPGDAVIINDPYIGTLYLVKHRTWTGPLHCVIVVERHP